MSASLISSFLVFAILGILEIASKFTGHSENWYSYIDPVSQAFVTATILANAVYFFYGAALAEWHPPTRDALRNPDVSRLEWCIRLGNQTMILFSWHALNSTSPLVYSLYLVALYSSCIWWGLVTHKVIPDSDRFLLRVDIAGFGISLIFVLLVWAGHIFDPTHPAPPYYWLSIGGVGVAYMGVAVVGVYRGWFGKTKFRPFTAEFRKRERLY